MLLSWFDAKAAKEFGSEMARIYIDCIPLSEKLSEKKLVALSRQALSKMSREVNDFKRSNKLNTYKTAQMGNSFKWVLKDAGYDDHQVNKLTEWLVAAAQ